jgi:Flp pilus assembly protein TadG
MTEYLGPPELERYKPKRSVSYKKNQKGSEILEFTLVLLPMLGFIFLILDIGWAVYSRSVLQYAVAEGVRFAVTDQTVNGLNQKASIQTIVQQHAFGRLGAPSAGVADGTCGWHSICVRFFQVDPSTGALTDVSSTTGSAPFGNGSLPLVEVSVESYSQKTFMPTIKMPGLGTVLNPLVMNAAAWDQVESPPIGGAPLP